MLWSLSGNCGRLDLSAGGGNFDPTGSTSRSRYVVWRTIVPVPKEKNKTRLPRGRNDGNRWRERERYYGNAGVAMLLQGRDEKITGTRNGAGNGLRRLGMKGREAVREKRRDSRDIATKSESRDEATTR